MEVESVVDHVSPEALHSLVTKSNFRLGEKIVKNGVVEVIEFGTLLVIAKVQPKSGLRRTVELRSTKMGLTWTTCPTISDTTMKVRMLHCELKWEISQI